MWQCECKLTIMTSWKKKKNGELCAQYVYFDEHQCPVLWRVTDRHITLSERETNGILPHLTAAAAAASTIISSLIMSNKATHRQTAFFSSHIPEKRISRRTLLSEEMFKKQSEACSFSLWFCLGRFKKKQHRGLESSSSRQKQKKEHSAPFAPLLWSLGKCNGTKKAQCCAGGNMCALCFSW